MLRRRGPERRESFAALVASALVAGDLPDVAPHELDLAGAHVTASIKAMPDVTRLGVAMAGRLTSVVLSLAARAPYSSLSVSRRAEVAAAVSGLHLPLVSEYGALTRSLGLVSVVESRHAPGGGG